ncbi:hypothetical protein LIER_07095 [Lithospermum erythrorhizon]|uniref:Transmembrane protein n=1 Tax=Lithospermum erythrorhizon TaxID=34254 RepID=A0AAV3PAQ7_LITER
MSLQTGSYYSLFEISGGVANLVTFCVVIVFLLRLCPSLPGFVRLGGGLVESGLGFLGGDGARVLVWRLIFYSYWVESFLLHHFQTLFEADSSSLLWWGVVFGWVVADFVLFPLVCVSGCGCWADLFLIIWGSGSIGSHIYCCIEEVGAAFFLCIFRVGGVGAGFHLTTPDGSCCGVSKVNVRDGSEGLRAARGKGKKTRGRKGF